MEENPVFPFSIGGRYHILRYPIPDARVFHNNPTFVIVDASGYTNKALKGYRKERYFPYQ